MRRVLGALPVWLRAAILGAAVGTWAGWFRPDAEAVAAGMVVAVAVLGISVVDRSRTLPDDVDELALRLRRTHRISSWAQPTLVLVAFALLLVGLVTTSLMWLVGVAVLVLMRLLWWEEYRTARHLRAVRARPTSSPSAI